MITNIVLYGVAAAALILTFMATNELENRFVEIEKQIEIQNTIIDKLRK
tara:strand:+ start:100 stop:246 length:147 start_codon:yes stop_codon:yes gene_type:complete